MSVDEKGYAHSGASKSTELLERITRTEIYSRLSHAAYERAKQEAGLMNNIIQEGLRAFHVTLLNRGLRNHLAIYMHSLDRGDARRFREFAANFRELGYQFVGPDRFLQVDGGKCVYLSFDDNYRQWYECADLLSETGITATFYVNTSVLRDRTSQTEIADYYDRINHQGERVPLSTQELLALATAGHTIGSHTRSHRVLTALEPTEAREEIWSGKKELEDILGRPVEHFSYPFGMRRHFSKELRSYCLRIGFRTIANAIPAMQHAKQSSREIQRSSWRLDRTLAWNLEDLRADGRLFTKFTGRSAVG
jgi:peptidoglycan/xylan/chitin deacetylase (PgdA/CDA1 family)